MCVCVAIFQVFGWYNPPPPHTHTLPMSAHCPLWPSERTKDEIRKRMQIIMYFMIVESGNQSNWTCCNTAEQECGCLRELLSFTAPAACWYYIIITTGTAVDKSMPSPSFLIPRSCWLFSQNLKYSLHAVLFCVSFILGCIIVIYLLLCLRISHEMLPQRRRDLRGNTLLTLMISDLNKCLLTPRFDKR